MLRSHFFARLFARTCLALGMIGVFAGSASAELKCLFITRDHGTHWTTVQKDRIAALGFTVDEAHENEAFGGFPRFNNTNLQNGEWTTEELNAYDLIYYDYDGSSGNIDQLTAANTTAPLVIQKFLGLNDQHRLVSADAAVHDTAGATIISDTQVEIANLPGHPILLEAGFAPGSSITISNTGAKQIQSIEPNTGATGLAPGAVVIAKIRASNPNFPGTASVWIFDQGAATHAGVTAGKRAGFGIFGAFPGTVVSGTSLYTAADLSPEAGKLFDAMIHWLVPASATRVTVAPNPLSFTGSTGATTTQTLVVTAGTTASSITLTAATLNPAGAPFSLSAGTLPRNILAGTSTTLSVGFTPVTSAVFNTTATLSFTNNAGPTTVNVPITATSSVNRIDNWVRFE